MDQRAILDHQFVVAAYVITWVLQLGYLAWLGLKWRSEKRNAERRSNHAH
jgi:threonine/homoserine/homoserine lactone efflux protein